MSCIGNLLLKIVILCFKKSLWLKVFKETVTFYLLKKPKWPKTAATGTYCTRTYTALYTCTKTVGEVAYQVHVYLPGTVRVPFRCLRKVPRTVPVLVPVLSDSILFITGFVVVSSNHASKRRTSHYKATPPRRLLNTANLSRMATALIFGMLLAPSLMVALRLCLTGASASSVTLCPNSP